jgi:predicted dehydrogenase
MSAKTKVGIIGCGNISDIYLENMCNVFDGLEVTACADLDDERAKEKAAKFDGVRALGVDELLADDDVSIVVNLTIPAAHAEVALAAVRAGKSVYNEKPLSISREDAKKLLDDASAAGVRVGCAPDTFLGAGLQTCRKLIDDGAIGAPVAATAFMLGRGPESWHPSPEFFYKVGGGPMFDMGPYYLTALISLMGPVKRVTGSARITFPKRTITSEPMNGKVIDVKIPTHIAGVLDFECGAVATLVTSFDVWGANVPRIEIYGAEGSLSVPDPNSFGGTVKLMGAGGEWKEVALTHAYSKNSRGIGVADMAAAIQSGRPHRASGAQAFHVLDLMHSFHDASAEDRHVSLESTCDQPAPLPAELKVGEIDD